MESVLVRVIGLEPTRLAAPEPKSGASTNFATPASPIGSGRLAEDFVQRERIYAPVPRKGHDFNSDMI